MDTAYIKNNNKLIVFILFILIMERTINIIHSESDEINRLYRHDSNINNSILYRDYVQLHCNIIRDNKYNIII